MALEEGFKVGDACVHRPLAFAGFLLECHLHDGIEIAQTSSRQRRCALFGLVRRAAP
jgi:hypothetical protein